MLRSDRSFGDSCFQSQQEINKEPPRKSISGRNTGRTRIPPAWWEMKGFPELGWENFICFLPILFWLKCYTTTGGFGTDRAPRRGVLHVRGAIEPPERALR